MQARFISPLIGAVLSVALLTPACASAQGWPGRNGPGWAGQSGSRAGVTVIFERGFREGLREGEQDAQQRRSFDLRRHGAYNDGDRGYNRDQGDRGRYRDEYRRGFESGYREGFERVRGVGSTRGRGRGPFANGRGVYDEPAYARGYAEGFDKGREDWEDRDRYDPVRFREYRDGDRGYNDNYGSRDQYKQHYREGFREGYEDGFRGGNRGFRR